MARKLIGLPMWSQGENSMGATKPYLEFFKEFGDIVLLAPNSFVPTLDLLVLPGGKDIVNGNPVEISFWNSAPEPFLEFFDMNTLPKYIAHGTPIYAICRGMQTVCRHFGIPLTQHIWWDHGDSKDMGDSKPNKLTYSKYNDYGHGKDAVETVGSWHHQGVTLEDFKKQEQFELIAHTNHVAGDRFSIVEFAEHKEYPIIIEQSHPERNQNRLEYALINKLLNIER